MTAPLILGIPAAAHREALLRETAGGGRVPMADGWACACGASTLWMIGDVAPRHRPPCCGEGWYLLGDALILSHPTDPEAGAMGLARLAHLIEPGGWWIVAKRAGGWVVELCWCASRWTQSRVWDHEAVPSLRDATSAAHAVGLVCVHLGLLERVEVQEVAELAALLPPEGT